MMHISRTRSMSMRVQSGVDRISALPDELLRHILSFVPTKTAIITSALSTRWRWLYTLVSSLDFVTDTDANAEDVERQNRFMNFVEKVLLSRTRLSVERFKLKFHHRIDPKRMNRWMRALVRRNIQELDLCCSHITRSWPNPSQLPARLFSCKTLVVLKLDRDFNRQRLDIPAKVTLPSLKVLHIGKAMLLSNGVERLFSSCPVLDDLVLDNCYFVIHINNWNLIITNATLTRLTITSWAFSASKPDRTPQLVINCPALVHLNLVLAEAYSGVLVAAESLAKVVIGSLSQHPSNIANSYDILRRIKSIQSLQIQDYIIQGFCYQNLRLSLFNNLTCLKIYYCGCLFDTHCLEYLLSQCVVLETLVFEHQHSKEHSTAQSTRLKYLLQQSRPTALLCHLKTVDIQLFQIEDDEVEALLKIIEFFLINAKVLEMLSVRAKLFPETQQLKITKATLTLPRVSKKCRVFVDELS